MRTTLARVTPLALLLLAVAPLAEAQYYGQPQQQYVQPLPQPGGDQPILYGVKKYQPPAGMVIEQGNAPPGIPMSGVQQEQQLRSNAGRRGPTTIYRDNRGLSVFTGPDGTTVCRDVRGRTVVCN